MKTRVYVVLGHEHNTFLISVHKTMEGADQAIAADKKLSNPFPVYSIQTRELEE